ncbi:MAG: hypothetical protein KF809_14660 [Chloroflexi bacterium]|nr:hypothetical protein [Chloroflexota bacterium]
MHSPSAHLRVVLVSLLVVTLVGVGLPAATLAAGPTSAELRAAESIVLKRINAQRKDRGLRAIRMDGRIQAVAQARSQDMVDRAYFSHTDPDGKLPWDHLKAAGIAYYAAGEIIAANGTNPIDAAAVRAVQQWMGSSGHKAQIVSTSFNYAGVGVAVAESGASYWTVVFIEGADRTKPKATLTKATSAVGSRTAKLRWSGTDPKLVKRTAGVASYDVQRRTGDGAWTTIRSRTTATSATTAGTKGVRYEFRVRARDKAGNIGAWSPVRGVTIR